MQIENYHVILLFNENRYCTCQLEINDEIVSKNDKLPQLILRINNQWIKLWMFLMIILRVIPGMHYFNFYYSLKSFKNK